MAGFDGVKVRKVSADEEESFLDYGGKATLFDEDESPADEDPDEEERETLSDEADEDELDDEDGEPDELAF